MRRLRAVRRRPDRRHARARPRGSLPGRLSRRRRQAGGHRALDGARGGAARPPPGAARDGRPGGVGTAQPAHARRLVLRLLRHAPLAQRGDYRGFPRNPELQLRWFTDTAILVRQRAIAAGAEDFGEPSGYGLWIADVERPAPQNRDGYQPYLDDADALVTGSCRPADHVSDSTPPALRVTAARRQRDAITLRVRCPAEPCMAGAQAEPRRRVRAAAPLELDGEAVTLTMAARSRRGARPDRDRDRRRRRRQRHPQGAPGSRSCADASRLRPGAQRVVILRECRRATPECRSPTPSSTSGARAATARSRSSPHACAASRAT